MSSMSAMSAGPAMCDDSGTGNSVVTAPYSADLPFYPPPSGGK
jgi:hypothetical protein